jgi:hypothetical protein
MTLLNVHIGRDEDANNKMSVHIVIHRLHTGELLAVVTPHKPKHALDTYKKRLTIETLFGNLKTRGFDMEQTHMTAPDKISMLLGMLALGVAAAAKTGIMASQLKTIEIKKHGRKAVSIFPSGQARGQCLMVLLRSGASSLTFTIIMHMNLSKVSSHPSGHEYHQKH